MEFVPAAHTAEEPPCPEGHKIRRRTETAPFLRLRRKTSHQIHAPRGIWPRKNQLRGERVLVMCCGNNNSCLWIILILILLFCCGGWGNCGCDNNNNNGCGCGC